MAKISGYQTYCLFLALKNHFRSETYDYFQYNGKTRANRHSYESRADRFWFEKLAKNYNKEELVDFFVANLKEGRKYVVELAKLDEDEARATHMQYVKRRESFTYQFEQDLGRLLSAVNTPKSLFRLRKGGYPEIISQYLNGQISLETLVVLDDFIRFSKVFDTKIGKDDVIWGSLSLLMRKFRPFVMYNKVKILEVLNKRMLNTGD